jgi:hypothetical protein
MFVPAYQIHNVLKVYTRQLSQPGDGAGGGARGGAKPSIGKINISDEGKRQAVIDKVAADIIERLSRFESLPADAPSVQTGSPPAGSRLQPPSRRQPAQFIFNVIDASNQKKSCNLPVEDSQFLSQRLEELVREAVGKKMTPSSGGLQ